MFFIAKVFIKWTLKLAIFLIVVLAILYAAFNWPVKSKNEDMKFGVSFSKRAVGGFGFDWKEVYLAILDDLKTDRVRVGAYWTDIEREKGGEYDFSDLEWQIEEAAKRDVEVIVAFGIKAPRWPECHIPSFYMNDKEEREEALLKYEKALVEKFKNYRNISMWQVENEPFLPFGDCPEGAIDENTIDKEIAQVRELDKLRKIMTTDSGELSLWYKAAKRGDVFGTTLYRIIYKEPFGHVTYPLGPSFFRIKAFFIKHYVDQENVIISELQAEPWGPGSVENTSIETQYKSMSPEKFRNIIEYAQKTNFSEAYLWGAEWWYWLKEAKNNDDMWEEARKVLN